MWERVPGMKAGVLAPVEELNHWQRMYQNGFFNPGSCYTEKDVSEVLSRIQCQDATRRTVPVYKVPCPGSSRPHRLSSAHNQWHHSLESHHLLHHKDHSEKIQEDRRELKHVSMANVIEEEGEALRGLLPSPKLAAHMSERAVSSSGGSSPNRWSRASGGSDKRKLLATRMLRRPLCEEAAMEAAPVTVDQEEFDAWRTSSFTTLTDEGDPLVASLFYSQNFALLMQQVPRRNKEQEDDVYLYTAPPETPHVSLTFFDELPFSRLSSSPSSSSSSSSCGFSRSTILGLPSELSDLKMRISRLSTMCNLSSGTTLTEEEHPSTTTTTGVSSDSHVTPARSSSDEELLEVTDITTSKEPINTSFRFLSRRAGSPAPSEPAVHSLSSDFSSIASDQGTV